MIVKRVSLILFFFSFFSCLALFGQGWERTFGGAKTDWGRAVVESSAGYFLMTGSQGDSIVVLQTNVWGELLWSKTYADKSSGYAIAETSSGNFIVAGEKGQNYYLLLLDSTGKVIWEKNFGSSNLEKVEAIALAPDGGFMLTGSSTSGSPEATDLVLLKTDSLGNLEWEKSYGGSGEQVGRAIQRCPDQGYILSGYSDDAGAYQAYLLKTDQDGLVAWEYQTRASAGSQPGNVQVNADGQYLFSHTAMVGNPPDNFSDNIFLTQLDKNGEVVWGKNYGDLLIDEKTQALSQGPDGQLLLCASLDNDLLLLQTDDKGNLLWQKQIGNALDNTPFYVAPSAKNGWIIAGQSQSALDPDDTELYLVKTDAQGQTFSNVLRGQIWNDVIDNCTWDANEIGLHDWTVQAANAQFIFSGTTDENGFYSIPIDSGTYTVEVFPPNRYWMACQNAVESPSLSQYDTTTIDFALQASVLCPSLTVDVSTPLLRRCQENIYYVNYCNWGTSLAETAEVNITFDDQLLVASSSLPWIDKDGQNYTFAIGDLEWGTCGGFEVRAELDCNATLDGQTHCVEARITPDTLCLPPDPEWDLSDIIVEGTCDVDSVRFEIINIGIGNVSKRLDYIITEDHIVLLTGDHQLPAGQSKAIALAANGATYRLETVQSAGHPIGNRPSATVEGCNNSGGNSSIGYVNQYAQDDLATTLSLDCQESISSSVDPPLLIGFPMGYEAKHAIELGTDLEYLIRFQNTGSDTVNRIMIVDTLSPHLDLSSLVPGASSHPYRFDILDERTLRILFDSIELIDRASNEEASRGFIKFRIAQQPNLPRETYIENQASIYFDYEAPISTNTTFHLVDTCFIEGSCMITSTTEIETRQLQLSPNPFHRKTTFTLPSKGSLLWQLSLYDLQGRLVREEEHRGDQFDLERGGLPDGIYFYRLRQEGQAWASGKLIIQ